MQVGWAQELTYYLCCINYCRKNVNVIVDTLLLLLQRSQTKEKTLKDENIHILNCLLISLIQVNIE